MCAFLERLLESALDPDVDTSALADCRLVVRCAAAVVRRHHTLAPEKCGTFLRALAKGLNAPAMEWQRIMVLQALKPMFADPVLVYR